MPDHFPEHRLTRQELQQIREDIRASIERAHAELERVELLILLAQLHDRGGLSAKPNTSGD